MLQELRGVLLATESARRDVLGVDHGIWIETFTTPPPTVTTPATEEGAEGETTTTSGDINDPSHPKYYENLMLKRYGRLPGSSGTKTSTSTTIEAVAPAAGNTNEIAVVNMTFRAVNMRQISPMANNDLAYELQRALQASPMFDPKETKLTGQIEVVDASAPTFSFGVTLRLKEPLKLL
jgi:hypothetical protein